jgi:hypothetical protein
MNEDEAMALVLRYARQFYKADAVYVPQLVLRFAAYCLQQMSEVISANLARRYGTGSEDCYAVHVQTDGNKAEVCYLRA